MPKNPLLSVKNLSIETKKKKLVNNISFEINQGQIFALVGESGSGKSLTALSVLDLLSKGLTQTGNLIFNGKVYDQAELSSLRGSEVAFIFQDPSNSLNPVMTVGEQIDEVIKANTSLGRSERLQKIRDSFNKVEMDSSDEMLNRYPHQISGGQKQRVLIAFALAADAKLIIADEPTTALDVTTQKTILKLLKNLQKTQKLSILLITHDLSVVKMMSDKVGVMYQGEIIEQQSSKAFFSKPQKEYSKSLISSIPSKSRKGRFGDLLMQVKKLNIHFPIKSGIFRRVKGFTKAVNNLDFDLYENQNIAIVGESGSGKTTTAMSLIRQQKITSGEISFAYKGSKNNIDSIPKNEYAKNVQIVFQNITSSFNPRKTIYETIFEGIRALNPSKSIKKYVDSLMKEVDLNIDLLDRYPHQLSGGQLQRCAIARALSVNPDVIICDEPTSALDASIKIQILDLLLKIQKEKKISYIVITHDMSIVSYFTDMILVMKDGEVIESGVTSKVLKSPKEDYTKELLGSILS